MKNDPVLAQLLSQGAKDLEIRARIKPLYIFGVCVIIHSSMDMDEQVARLVTDL